MCFAQKLPEPKPAPPPPNPADARRAAIYDERSRFAKVTGRNQTILTRLSDEEVSASATRKRLLGE